MAQDFLLSPQLDPQRLALLTRLAQCLDTQLDHPNGLPQPVDSAAVWKSSAGSRRSTACTIV